jgi:hypothetical protein
MGSGFVDGFADGDVLIFAQVARSNSESFVHRVRLAAFDRGGSNQISTVFIAGEHVLAAGERWSRIGTSYVVPPSGTGWALFTSSLGEGEGEYEITVRCKPANPDGVNPVS